MKKFILIPAAIFLMAFGCNKVADQNTDKSQSQNNGSSSGSSQQLSKPSQDQVVSEHQHRYTSYALGVTFTYEPQPFPGVKIIVTETPNKLIVHGDNENPDTGGQSVEVFQKDPNQTFKQAIEQRFLQGISSADCYVEDEPFTQKHPVNQVYAGIGYPDPDPTNDLPAFAEDYKCPKAYSETNGLQYFMMDTLHPDRFFFVRVGQDSITSDGNPRAADGSSQNWSASVTVIDKQ